jgi:hypothetical protein
MNKLEKILGLIVLVALIFKLTLITGGGILIVLSLSVLAIIYYPFGFALFNKIGFQQIFKRDSYKGLSALRIIGAIGVGTALSIICIGILFKLQHWPGSKINLLAGLITSLILLIIILIKYSKNKDDFYTMILKRLIIIGGFGLIMILTSDLTIIKIQFRNHPDYIKAFELYQINPNNESYQKNLEIEYHRATMSPKDFEFYMEHYK